MIEERIELAADKDVVAAWRSGLSVGRKLGFGQFKQACLSGAILELSRNLIERGDSAACVISDASDDGMLRARVVIESTLPSAADVARTRMNTEMNIAPGVPAVRLHNVVESCDVQARPDSTRIVFTINQQRPSRLPARR